MIDNRKRNNDTSTPYDAETKDGFATGGDIFG